MNGYVVLFDYGFMVLPKYYKTLKNARKFADEHNDIGKRTKFPYKALILNVEYAIAWEDCGVAELERLYGSSD